MQRVRTSPALHHMDHSSRCKEPTEFRLTFSENYKLGLGFRRVIVWWRHVILRSRGIVGSSRRASSVRSGDIKADDSPSVKGGKN